MAVQRFEDLQVWNKSQDLAVKTFQEFENCKLFSLKDQIFRASVSISNNIAEGFERNSNKDFTRFLFISLGSVSEVRSMLYLACRLQIIDEPSFNQLKSLTDEISKMLYGLIKSMKMN
ncbi:four helix bundle protein [Mesonia sp. K7]|uniref:four helix bundle protein n=1 Tax=Mesonia sp. K7 TaxID=2218606 RepID=UPI000DA882D5|nr:four helix bundle protein [Mesonia sp. K7]PZD77721.1 four helix bundle protein [Mesonia sp. K7]